MQFGLYTFADIDPASASHGSAAAQRLSELLEEVVLADDVGFDIFGLGEHHRPDYVASAPAIILAAIAMRTKRIRLSSAVTVLSSDDPVRVFQQFATLDALSNGRAEIMAGRGSFIESFPLFGYRLEDYDDLFTEKLDLLLALRDQVIVNWEGTMRTPIHDRGVYPRPVQDKLPIWIAAGGTAQSAVRAGLLGLPLALAIIGGEPSRFAPLFELYRSAAKRAGNDLEELATSINVHGYVAETSQLAKAEFYGPQAEVMNRIGRERGWAPTNMAQFEAAIAPKGAIFAGSPDQVAEKIIANHEIFKFDRFMIQMAIGTIPHLQLMKAIELFAAKVMPQVKQAIGDMKNTPSLAQ